MNHLIWTVAAAATPGLSASAFAQASPYAGEQQRSIKVLDARDVAGLRQARKLGEAMIQAELALDRPFADRQATADRVGEATQRIASLQAQLRAEHLNTHLTQTALMTPAQAQRYAELRGYSSTTPASDHQHGHRH